jgi:hypothetical protein
MFFVVFMEGAGILSFETLNSLNWWTLLLLYRYLLIVGHWKLVSTGWLFTFRANIRLFMISNYLEYDLPIFILSYILGYRIPVSRFQWSSCSQKRSSCTSKNSYPHLNARKLHGVCENGTKNCKFRTSDPET